MIRMRMGNEDQADVSRAPAGALERVANPLRPAPHAGINDNDAFADQKEALDHIQRDVMNRNYRSAHIFSKVLSATPGRRWGLHHLRPGVANKTLEKICALR